MPGEADARVQLALPGARLPLPCHTPARWQLPCASARPVPRAVRPAGAHSHVAELPWAGPSAGPLCSPRAPSPADGQRRARGCFTVSSHSRCLHVCPRRWGACKGGCRQPGARRHFAELSPLCRAVMAPGVSPHRPGGFSVLPDG